MRAFDVALRVIGGGVAVALGAMTAVLEALSTPRLWAIPVAAAMVGNLLLYWFTRYTIAQPWAWILAAAPWFLIMLVAVGSTGEGDLIANSWTGVATFGAGALGFFVPAAVWPWPDRAPESQGFVR